MRSIKNINFESTARIKKKQMDASIKKAAKIRSERLREQAKKFNLVNKNFRLDGMHVDLYV